MSADTDVFGSDLERRVLGNLPRYRQPGELVEVGTKFDTKTGEATETQEVPYEDHLREVNGHDADWSPPQSMKVDELLERLRADDGTVGVPEADAVAAALASLAEKGLVDRAGDAVSMSEAGLAALTS